MFVRSLRRLSTSHGDLLVGASSRFTRQALTLGELDYFGAMTRLRKLSAIAGSTARSTKYASIAPASLP